MTTDDERSSVERREVMNTEEQRFVDAAEQVIRAAKDSGCAVGMAFFIGMDDEGKYRWYRVSVRRGGVSPGDWTAEGRYSRSSWFYADDAEADMEDAIARTYGAIPEAVSYISDVDLTELDGRDD